MDNKVVEFLKSLVLPRKMVKYMNMNFFVSLLLLMIAGFLNISTSNLHAAKDARESNSFPELFTKAPADFKIDGLPVISVDEKDAFITADNDGVYTNTFIADDKKMEVTIVINKDLSTLRSTVEEPAILTGFDFEGYTKRVKEENTEYLLYVLTKDVFYFLFDLEQDANGESTKKDAMLYAYEVTSDNKDFQYYLPASEEELSFNEYNMFDTTKWTRKCAKGDKLDFEIKDATFASRYQEIKPATRHVSNLSNALYGTAYTYASFETKSFDVKVLNKSFKNFQENLIEFVYEIDTDYIKSMSLIMSFLITMIFPLILSLICWLMSKQFYMTKYRQYFAICSMCFTLASIIAVVAGFFVSYFKMAFVILLVAAIYYIVATFRINTLENDNKTKNQNKSNDEPKKPFVYESDSARIG